ncbi:DUF3291 domain-containing protein [Cochleicola gelatinilyticus]|uniref:DUF3291 domain-containing protein n=1 Tax=Cochleicola gelatinilyticus TaxID=1763537 RepID=A0A167H5S3_9FLAO|nr:DUF3291 domain-containing protein [Cochleicola gelatinilyticus]OAB78244.1 hypothetical protein ULVI_12265 [Cochleicola gelatinilyticus]
MHLAQLNIAEAIETMEHPMMSSFMENVDRINELAEKSPGFVWRLSNEEESNTPVFNSTIIAVNLSIWKDRESLFQFVYASNHVEILKRKSEWFKKTPKLHMVLWYIEEGHIPSIKEASERLLYLQEHGESPFAFSFKSSF